MAKDTKLDMDLNNMLTIKNTNMPFIGFAIIISITIFGSSCCHILNFIQIIELKEILKKLE